VCGTSCHVHGIGCHVYMSEANRKEVVFKFSALVACYWCIPPDLCGREQPSLSLSRHQISLLAGLSLRWLSLKGYKSVWIEGGRGKRTEFNHRANLRRGERRQQFNQHRKPSFEQVRSPEATRRTSSYTRQSWHPLHTAILLKRARLHAMHSTQCQARAFCGACPAIRRLQEKGV
jgi:hypothetical protein